MKQLIIVVCICVGCALLMCAPDALAADPVVCEVPTSTSVAANTLTGADSGVCTWQKGATLLMQCHTSVYIDTSNVAYSTAALEDGGTLVSGGVATALDQRINFTPGTDPYTIYLNPQDRHVSLLAVADDGGCKFMTTVKPGLRR